VIVEAAISDTGKVENVGVIKSVAPGLDMAAAAAVRDWKFRPATRNGKPVPVLYNLTVNFKLK
jgi:periplasmic protein TonB